MANKISDRAVIGPEVKMGDDVTIGPFVFIAGNVVIGDHVTIYSNVSMSGKIIIGDHCMLFPNVSVVPNWGVIISFARIRCLAHSHRISVSKVRKRS